MQKKKISPCRDKEAFNHGACERFLKLYQLQVGTLETRRQTGPKSLRLGPLGPAWFSLGVAGCADPRHITLWIVSFLNERMTCSREPRLLTPGHCSEREHRCSVFGGKTKTPEDVFCLSLSNQQPANREKSVDEGT